MLCFSHSCTCWEDLLDTTNGCLIHGFTLCVYGVHMSVYERVSSHTHVIGTFPSLPVCLWVRNWYWVSSFGLNLELFDWARHASQQATSICLLPHMCLELNSGSYSFVVSPAFLPMFRPLSWSYEAEGSLKKRARYPYLPASPKLEYRCFSVWRALIRATRPVCWAEVNGSCSKLLWSLVVFYSVTVLKLKYQLASVWPKRVDVATSQLLHSLIACVSEYSWF